MADAWRMCNPDRKSLKSYLANDELRGACHLLAKRFVIH